MMQHMKIALFVLIGLAVLATSAGSASAVDIVSPAGSSALAQRNGDYQALRSQIQRQQFQQQQQQNRLQDRSIAPPLVLEVPKVKPSCQIQVYGNSYLKSCR